MSATDRAIVAAALVAALAWEFAGLDMVVMRSLADAHGFRWRDAWLTATVLHDGARILVWIVAAILALDAWRPLVSGPPPAARWRALAVTLALATLASLLKQASATSCPWELAQFGGVARYVPHWLPGGDGGPGHCFPSGHAAAAFCFLAIYFAWRPYRPWLARAILVAILGFGALLGAAQVLRGAHYPSHVFWSAWLCWTAAAVLQPGRRDSAAATMRSA